MTSDTGLACPRCGSVGHSPGCSLAQAEPARATPAKTYGVIPFALTKASLPILARALYFIVLASFVALSIIISLSLSLAPL
jgi:hypothetical protein